MTDKRTLKGIDRIKDSLELKNYEIAINNGKNIIDNLVLNSHYWLFKNKPARKPIFPLRQIERILNITGTKPELKKIVDKKTIKLTLKWYSKYKEYKTDPTSKPAKNPSKFAKKTFNVITLLNITTLRLKTYYRK